MKFVLEEEGNFGKDGSALILAECLAECSAKESAKEATEEFTKEFIGLQEFLQTAKPLETWRKSLLQLLAQRPPAKDKQSDGNALSALAALATSTSESETALPVRFSTLQLEAKTKELGSESAALLQWGKSLGEYITQQKWRHILFPAIPGLSTEQFRLVLEGLWFACYQFAELKSKKKPEITVSLYATKFDSAFLQDFEQQIESLKQTFKLVVSPANICTPEFFSDFAVRQMAELKNVKTVVWGEEQLEKEGMNLILAVGRGSPRESRLLMLDYCGDTNSTEHFALVGKGVCFDTGGTNLKPSASIKGMQYDMMGGAVVYGAFHYLASTGFPANLRAYIPLVENQIGSEAIKTGDIIPSAMGPTVEINNTDAEGRLILADAIHYAVQQKPRLLIDCATLTGAAIVALGEQCAAYYSNDEDMAALFAQASQKTAENTWRMPLFRPYATYLESKLADVSNISTKSSAGGSLTAALFLEKFAVQHKDKHLPWLHLDLAAWSSLDEHPSFGKNTYAMGLRLLARFLRSSL